MTLVYHPDYIRHRQTWGHPEDPSRLTSIVDKLRSWDLFDEVLSPSKPESDEVLLLVHTPDYIDIIKNFGEGYLDPDTYHHEETFEIAQLAAEGAALAAYTSFDEQKPVFALLRPPGHHAGKGYSGGFCYFNNIAIAAEYLINKRKARRVAIVDIDLHHGNGTEDIFSDRSDVLYISTHQWGIYPGSGALQYAGEKNGEGFTINIPLRHGCGDATFKLAFEKVIEPVLKSYRPDAILVSFGGDAHYSDPLGGLALSTPGYLDLTHSLIDLASSLTGSRIAFYLEGGYNVKALAETVAGTVLKFYGKSPEDDPDLYQLEYTDVKDVQGRGASIIDDVVEFQKKFWSL